LYCFWDLWFPSHSRCRKPPLKVVSRPPSIGALRRSTTYGGRVWDKCDFSSVKLIDSSTHILPIFGFLLQRNWNRKILELWIHIPCDAEMIFIIAKMIEIKLIVKLSFRFNLQFMKKEIVWYMNRSWRGSCSLQK
jgi:hypothetical protein